MFENSIFFLIGIYITYKVNTFNLSLRGVVILMKPYLLIDELNYYHETLCYIHNYYFKPSVAIFNYFYSKSERD